MPSKPSMKPQTSSPQSSPDHHPSLKSARSPRRCLSTPSLLRLLPNMLLPSLPSPNWPSRKDPSTNQPSKELLNSSKPWERTSKPPSVISRKKTPLPSKPSTNRRKDSKVTLTDLPLNSRDSPTKLTDLTNALEPNPPSPRPHPTSSRETNNFGIKPPPFATPSRLNTTMPPPQEDKNSNSLLNSRRWLRRDSLKSMMRTVKDKPESKRLLNDK